MPAVDQNANYAANPPYMDDRSPSLSMVGCGKIAFNLQQEHVMSNIGFIGLGIMGKPMALNLIKGGHTLFLNSRSGVAKELTDAGGKACGSAKEVAQKSDIIITMVPDTPDVEKVLFG